MKPLDIEICDVTPKGWRADTGCIILCKGKSDIATMLDDIGIEVIEAGFPAVSANEKQCVKHELPASGWLPASAVFPCREADIQTAIDCELTW